MFLFVIRNCCGKVKRCFFGGLVYMIDVTVCRVAARITSVSVSWVADLISDVSVSCVAVHITALSVDLVIVNCLSLRILVKGFWEISVELVHTMAKPALKVIMCNLLRMLSVEYSSFLIQCGLHPWKKRSAVLYFLWKISKSKKVLLMSVVADEMRLSRFSSLEVSVIIIKPIKDLGRSSHKP